MDSNPTQSTLFEILVSVKIPCVSNWFTWLQFVLLWCLITWCSSFFRLTPSYMFAIHIQTSLYPYIINSPDGLLVRAGAKHDQCHKHWWSNLLYINNIYPWKMAEEVVLLWRVLFYCHSGLFAILISYIIILFINIYI